MDIIFIKIILGLINMSRYRRAWQKGGTFFFTVALANRKATLLTDHIGLFKDAYRRVWRERPFDSVAVCVLPDHLHAVWTLPENDDDFSTRWQLIKRYFSYHFEPVENRSLSKLKHREKGIWQRRFWEHQVCDDEDLNRCVDYVHFNPVKHGYVTRCSDWKYSSFHQYVRRGWLPEDWGGADEVMRSVGWGERE